MWIFVRLESSVIETLTRGVGLKINSVGMAEIHCNIILVSWGETSVALTKVTAVLLFSQSSFTTKQLGKRLFT